MLRYLVPVEVYESMEIKVYPGGDPKTKN